jgi:carboxyl-terminal processing protease
VGKLLVLDARSGVFGHRYDVASQPSSLSASANVQNPEAYVAAVNSNAQHYSNVLAEKSIDSWSASSADLDRDQGEIGSTNKDDFSLSEHQTLSRVLLLIRDNYVEPERIHPQEMFVAALDSVQKLVPEVLVDDHHMPHSVTVAVGSIKKKFELGEIHQVWEVGMALNDIFRFLQHHLPEKQVQRDIEYAAINGMLATLDPHSILLKPENFDEVKLSTRGEFGGLGIVISIRDGGLTVISPIEGSPAANAGIKAKDKIVKIGEESTVNMALDEAVQKLRGQPGSNVTLSVMRKNFTEPKDFILTRALIKIESVTSELLSDGIGYIKIKSFQGNTFKDLQTHLAQLKAKYAQNELKGLILDLRNNPGGLLDQAILVSDRFIDKGPLVITVGEGNRKREVKEAEDTGDENLYPMVVLLNGGSASASEIVAGALKNHNRAVILGQQSFGKGSVQVLYDFKDSSALKLTIAQYLTPGDVSIQSVGIAPDVQVVPAVIEKDNLHVFVDDDAPREKDLEKHLDRQVGSTTSIVDPSRIKITHLMPPDPDGEQKLGEEEVLNMSNTNDFETRLAHEMLVSAQANKHRQKILQSEVDLFKRRVEEEENHIAEQLQKWGVDWAKPPILAKNTNSNVKIFLQVKEEKENTKGKSAQAAASSTARHAAGSAHVLAGSSILLHGSVTNHGDAPLYRVHGETYSDNPFLKNLEFAFGKIPPHETRSWDVRLKVPADMPERIDRIDLKLSDAQGFLAEGKGALLLHVQEPHKVGFAARYQVLADGNKPFDGLLHSQDNVSLRIDLRNTGEAVAQDITLTLKNLSGKAIFLDEGRAKIDTLAPNAVKSVYFHFKTNKIRDLVRLRLSVWDNQYRSILSDRISLPTGKKQVFQAQSQAVSPKPGQRWVPIYSAAHSSSALLGFLPAQSVVAQGGVLGDFARLKLTEEVYGFVPQKLLRKSESLPKPKSNEKSFSAVFPVEAPSIELIKMHQLITQKKNYEITGTIKSNAPLMDIFVFVNDKKVYYHAAPKHALEGSGKRKANHDVKLHLLDKLDYPFHIPMELKAGSNNIVIYARQTKEMVGHKIFTIYKEDAVAPTVVKQ